MFKKKFYKGKPHNPPFNMMLEFSQDYLQRKAAGSPNVELSMNGIMVKFIQSALS